MLKKILPIVLAFCLLTVAGCSKNSESLSVDKGSEPAVESSKVEETVEKELINPLTGLNDVTEEAAGNRPVAVMVNNISVAQPVQTGLNKADIIYETEVEGGITRLMAVFQDLSKVTRLGSIRSSRYVYIDLAMGHNAIYLYHGVDGNYAAPHLFDSSPVKVTTANGGMRVDNGLATEHTLYVDGAKIWEKIKTYDYDLKNDNTDTWVDFADKESPVIYDNKANSISVKFSSSYITEFKYDEASGRYIRYFDGTERKDYATGESITVKNVFVLNTEMSHYPIEKYRKIELESGSGYYFVNGTYTPITWSKGDSSNSFVFKNSDGTELTVNPGNSWVCIVNEDNNQPVME